MSARNVFLLFLFLGALSGCANISSPTGGKKDVTPPKLMSVTPSDSLLNTRVTKLEMYFDEYITLGDASKEIEVSPILPVPPIVTGINKHIKLKITDSLLEDNTTYRISFGSAITDLHEANPFVGYTYTFSTGGYFDSLQLRGKLINAATGLPDTSSVIVLYKDTENDSAIVKKKPRYKTKPNGVGVFTFKGLPAKKFRIYAIKDDNNNLIYDGGTEMVAFCDSTVAPTDTASEVVTLRLFAEIPDSTTANDTLKTARKSLRGKERKTVISDTNLIYTINVDTSNIEQRTFNLADSIKMVFNREPAIDLSKIIVTYDSTGGPIDIPTRVLKDAKVPTKVTIASSYWRENTVYTLHLNEGCAVDTGGVAADAATYKFRTFNDDDFGKISIRFPSKYLSGDMSVGDTTGADYVLVVKADNDTLYQKKITDTIIKFTRLRPATYTFRIIVDKNKNGFWDTGDLLGKRQPEEVIPSTASVALKAGWEHDIDFEQKEEPDTKKGDGKTKSLRKK